MKQNLETVITIPEGVNVNMTGQMFNVKANGKEINRMFLENPKIKLEKKDNAIVLSSKNATKRELKILNSISAHIYNLFAGLKEDYLYKLEICTVHFPVTVKLEGNKFKIKNTANAVFNF